MVSYNQEPLTTVAGKNRKIAVFTIEGNNIDSEVVKSFGEEWLRFQHFSTEMITRCGTEYFDLLSEAVVNKNSCVLDIGCGTGRWTKYLVNRCRFIEAVDPSNAIFAADNLLGDVSNVRLTKASIESRLPTTSLISIVCNSASCFF